MSVLVDQRRDLLKSTTAALDYLASLHQQTQDWHLALAAYNWGVGRLLKLRDSALAQGQLADFASLAARMPEETRHYVPQIEALKRLIMQADADDLPEGPDQPLVQTVPLAKDLDMALAAGWAGLSVPALMQLNHAVHPPVILAAATPELLLPAETAEQFEAAAQAHRGPWSSWTVVRTQGHAKLKQLASQYGTTPEQLRQANGGAAGMKPTTGSALLVPRTGASPAKTDAALVATAQRQWVPEVVRIHHRQAPTQGDAGSTCQAPAGASGQPERLEPRSVGQQAFEEWQQGGADGRAWRCGAVASYPQSPQELMTFRERSWQCGTRSC